MCNTASLASRWCLDNVCDVLLVFWIWIPSLVHHVGIGIFLTVHFIFASLLYLPTLTGNGCNLLPGMFEHIWMFLVVCHAGLQCAQAVCSFSSDQLGRCNERWKHSGCELGYQIAPQGSTIVESLVLHSSIWQHSQQSFEMRQLRKTQNMCNDSSLIQVKY